MQDLVDAIKNNIPSIIKEMNKVCIPSLEKAWGRKVTEQMQFWDNDQVSVEFSKNFSIPLNNCFFRAITSTITGFEEKTTRGSDYLFNGIPIEDKNTFSGSGKGWVGNGFGKCDWHLLKRFKIDLTTGRIVECFAMLVNLKNTKGAWGEKTNKEGKTSQRVGLSFLKEDIDKLIIIYGSVKVPKGNRGKWLEFVTEKV